VTNRGDNTYGQLIGERERVVATLNGRGERASSQRETGKAKRQRRVRDKRTGGEKREGERRERESDWILMRERK
jgi:hypothetical protein